MCFFTEVVVVWKHPPLRSSGTVQEVVSFFIHHQKLAVCTYARARVVAVVGVCVTGPSDVCVVRHADTLARCAANCRHIPASGRTCCGCLPVLLGGTDTDARAHRPPSNRRDLLRLQVPGGTSAGPRASLRGGSGHCSRAPRHLRLLRCPQQGNTKLHATPATPATLLCYT